MIFLKWYSFTMLLFGFICSLYKYAKEDNFIGYILLLLLELPILIFIMLS